MKLPSNSLAERAVLATAMMSSEPVAEIAALSEELFFSDSHRKVFRAVRSLARLGKPADFIMVSGELQKADDLEAVGGHAFLVSLTDSLPRALNLEHYIGLLVDGAQRRLLLRHADALKSSACDQSVEVAATLEQSERVTARVRSMERRAATAGETLMHVNRFIQTVPENVDWLVQGVIPRGACGVIAALPRGGKSWAAADLCLALATGQPWLEFRVPSPVTVALISREDPAPLTGWRLRNLACGRGLAETDDWGALFVNSRAQTPTLAIDDDSEMSELTEALQARRTEFVVLDVFNKLHGADENDQTAMMRVLKRVEKLAHDLNGASVCLVHHFNKASGDGQLISRVRGSGAIAGWTQWIVGLSISDETNRIRRCQIETKAGESPDEFSWRIASEGGQSRLVRVDHEAAPKARSATTILGGGQTWHSKY